MKTPRLSALFYEAQRTSLLPVRMEQNLLVFQTGTGSGQNVTFETESDFNELFGS